MVRTRRLLVLLATLLISATLAGTVMGNQTGTGPDDTHAWVDPELHDRLAGDGILQEAAIVVHTDDTPQAIEAFMRLDLEHHTLKRLGMSQVLVDRDAVDALAREPSIRHIWADHVLELHLDEANELVRTPEAWEAFEVRGEGATVLVIDSGIDALHPDLMDRVVENAQPHDPLDTGMVPQGYTEGVPANDWVGHGTHVAGIVGGTGQGLGTVDPSHGRYIGVAPGVDIAGWAIPGLGSANNVFQGLQGFEYALEHQERLNIRVITNSWGISAPYTENHPINLASNIAYRSGMAIVFSAGNSGTPSQGNTATNMFSTAPWAVSVAAANKDGSLAGLSSRGTDVEESGHEWDHPTITAPGVSIMAAKSRIGAMQALGPIYIQEPPGDLVGQATHYQYASGTSMSAPMVAGALGLMFSANKELAPDQAYDILVATATVMDGYEYFEVGAGMMDVYAAVEQSVETEGTLDRFISGQEQKYADPGNTWDDPLKVHLDMHPGRSNNGSDAGEFGQRVAEAVPAAPAMVLVFALLAFVTAARRR